MRKKKNRSKIDETMMFYGQRLCPICKKLIVASNPKSYEAATRDLGRKMKAHKEEHEKEKEGKKLNLLIAGTLGEQSQTIRRVTLRGEKKS